MSKPIVGYWDIRGLAQPIRLLLTYLNIDFEDVRFTQREDWFAKKFEMGFDFPNVSFLFPFLCFSIFLNLPPYLRFHITSKAILR